MDEEDEFDDGEGLSTEELKELNLGYLNPERRSPWSLLGTLSEVLANVFEDVANGFHEVGYWLDQRAAWEEDRQEFSDSVKSDFLMVKTLEPEQES